MKLEAAEKNGRWSWVLSHDDGTVVASGITTDIKSVERKYKLKSK